jgi:dTDP-4-dehydrorhamnose reductase
MAKVLITGAKGQLGSELTVASKKYFSHSITFTDIDTLDITDAVKTQQYISDLKPEFIVNCAAYNLVDKAETDYEQALMINSIAVKNIASIIRDSTCRLMHISSDYVFDGKATTPYLETARPQPLSAYGRSKLEGEKNALLHPETMVIRTSWLYSEFGNNFVKTILRLAKEKGSIRVVNDQIGCPTYAADFAQAILAIIFSVTRQQNAFNTGIYHYSNEGSCSWHEFATAIVEEAGIPCEIIPVTTAEYKAAAPRPAYSVLSKSKITDNYNLAIPHWKVSLKKFINRLKEMEKENNL